MRTTVLILHVLFGTLPAFYFLLCYNVLVEDAGSPGKLLSHSFSSFSSFRSSGSSGSFSRPRPVTSVASIGRYDLIITEIMADPSPPAGLPEYEYVEIKNVSSKPVDLKGCALGDESGSAKFNVSLLLPPDSFLICCSNTAATKLQAVGRIAGLSNFPSFANETDLVQLLSPDGRVIHAVQYETSWFRNSLKANGGWSLEMINSNTPCAGASNWAASNDPRGGTPGRSNSQPTGGADEQPPALLHTYTIDSANIVAVFDEPIDSNSAAQPNNYFVAPSGNQPFACKLLPPFFNTVQLQFRKAFVESSVYELNARRLKDCAANEAGVSIAKAGLPSPVSQGDIIINEILFDPPPDGADYVELFNRSGKVISLEKLYCSNRGNDHQLVNSKPVSTGPALLFPGDYILLSENIEWVKSKFVVKNRNALLPGALPSLSSDKGSLLLSNAAGEVLDECHYSADWHFPLLTATESISLERIDPQHPTQDKNNWLSAAATAGGGTPGYLNSQYQSMASGTGSFQLSSSVFSPDLDGRDDLLLIRYNMPVPGAAGTVRVFDLDGKPVRQLVNNALMGASGHWSWDGLSEAKQPLPSGIYVVQVSWFNVQGMARRWKQAVVLMRGRK